MQWLKTSTILCTLLLLQACSTTPRILNYGDMLKTVGGSEIQARDAAFNQCKKFNPFFFEIEIVNEHFNVEGKVRDFKCKFWEQNSELERPSSLQQRVLQTRKFNKNPTELQNAMNAWIRHSGGSGAVFKDAPVFEADGKITQPKTGKLHASFGDKFLPILRISGAFRVVDENTVIVRITTFANSTEVFSPKLYQLIFNQIAEELFTQAIKLDPAEVK